MTDTTITLYMYKIKYLDEDFKEITAQGLVAGSGMIDCLARLQTDYQHIFAILNLQEYHEFASIEKEELELIKWS